MDFVKLYRAIRPNEIQFIRDGGGLRPPCYPCNDDKKCCKKTVSDHVNSGTRAKIKSRYVSLTKEPSIAALWSSTSDGTPKKIYSGMFVEVYLPVNILKDTTRVIDVTKRTDLGLGNTALNNAKASEEVLIKDGLDQSEVLSFSMWNSKIITKDEYDKLPDIKIKKNRVIQTKFWGKRKKKENPRYVVTKLVYHNSNE